MIEYQQFHIIRASSNQGKSKNNGKESFLEKKKRKQTWFYGTRQSTVYQFIGVNVYIQKKISDKLSKLQPWETRKMNKPNLQQTQGNKDYCKNKWYWEQKNN